MSWVFSRENQAGEEAGTFEARLGCRMYLVAAQGIMVVPTAPQDMSTILGIATVESSGVKLHAVGAPLEVVPQKDASTDLPTEEYTLQPENNGQIEIILLRPNDKIYSSRSPGRLALRWRPPQVLVNSSVTAEGEIPESEDQTMKGDASKPEEETEDDDDLDRTVMSTVQPSARSTPLLSAPRTEVVQETPHVNRVIAVTDLSSSKPSPSPVEETTPEEVPAEGRPPEEAEVFSTAPAKRHPTVHIPAKRASPAAETDSKSISGRLTKRTKIEGDTGSDETSAVQHPIRKTATKPKKRVYEAQHQEALTPSNTQRSSQRSSQRSVEDDGDEYTGPTPRVAFSNSAIPESGKEAMKFLKKHGTSVESVNDDCNILCVKDGTLVKTLKLLQAIALGIPVVTDKWLLSSAKARRFLPLSRYIPHAPVQEKEWNFSLSHIWNKPQKTLFNGYTIHFTPALKATYKTFAEIEQVCKAVGARRIVSKKAGGKEVDEEDTIVLALEEGDVDAKVLIEKGRECFSKDFLTNSILRGEVDRQSDEFRILGVKADKGGKKGRPRKS